MKLTLFVKDEYRKFVVELEEMLKHTAPGTTGSFNAGMGWVPRATRA